MPKVSIILPNYNHGAFLAQRLESIFSQIQQDFELIFLDDASTDNSLEVFQSFAGDPRIRAEFNGENSRSPFKQWNRGFELARGEYVWIAESDDYSDDRFLQVMIDMLERHPSAALAYCQSFIADEKGKLETFPDWYWHLIDSERWTKDYCSKGEYELANYFTMQNIIPNASAVVFRRKLVEGLPRAPEEMQLCGDWMFWSQLATRGDVCFVAKPLNFWRRTHAGSQRSRTAPQALEVLEGLEVFKFISQHVELRSHTRRSVLQLQLKRWARIAFEQNLDPETRDTIYKQILLCHPEIGPATFRRIKLPFVYYYLVVPLKRIPFVAVIHEKLKRALRWPFKKLSKLKKVLVRKPWLLPFWIISGRAHIGFCPICSRKTLFGKYGSWLREHYKCVKCLSIPRQRALIRILQDYFSDLASQVVHESSPSGVSSDWIAYHSGEYVATHFFKDVRPGQYQGNLRCENLEQMTFADEEFDLIVSQDVMEHVLDPARAFKEISRTLKPGGAHVFTVPIYPRKTTLIRARHGRSGIEYLEKPIYHGNPTDKNGSLVVTEWGDDLLEFIKTHSGMKTARYTFDDSTYGLQAEFLDVLVSRKPTHDPGLHQRPGIGGE